VKISSSIYIERKVSISKSTKSQRPYQHFTSNPYWMLFTDRLKIASPIYIKILDAIYLRDIWSSTELYLETGFVSLAPSKKMEYEKQGGIN
jgi:hypothetical protein